jgi:peptidoglycan/xylan/chitin deacetylase (PgdA/CDA1 family)
MKIILVFCLLLSSSTWSKEIAFTFDDAPRGDEKIYTGEQRTKRLIEVLKRHHIHAAFFVNTDRFSQHHGRERIEAYAKAGHFIANHTHQHTRLTADSLPLFLQDIDRTHELIKNMSTFRPWFRFPYLREGETLQVRDAARKHLQRLGYLNGYVTVDNYDYFINDLVQKAIKAGKKVAMKEACGMLVDLMMDGVKYYEEIAQKNIGVVRHVLLMHENDIEAYCLDDLIAKLKSEKWDIVSPEKAFADPLLKTEPDTLYLNQGRVAAIAHVKTGIRYVTKWENEKALEDEFTRRKIVK